VILPIWGNEKLVMVEKQRTIEVLNKELRAYMIIEYLPLQMRQILFFLT
jgi:hypothetical protein